MKQAPPRERTCNARTYISLDIVLVFLDLRDGEYDKENDERQAQHGGRECIAPPVPSGHDLYTTIQS
jgi:hypothetical protein